MTKKTGHFATRAFQYDEIMLQAGEIFELKGRPNDAVLISAGHISEIREVFPSGVDVHDCVRCNRKFVDSNFKFQHDVTCERAALELESKERNEQQLASVAAGGEGDPGDPANWPGERTAEVQG